VARYRLKKSIFRTTIFFLPTLHSEAAWSWIFWFTELPKSLGWV
jgi:hypothetical protein